MGDSSSGQWTSFDPDRPSGWSVSDFRSFCVSSRWIFARTMPDNPHHYTLRSATTDGNFDSAVRFIREHGHMEEYYGKPYRALHLEGFKYWTMGARLAATILINRKALEAHQDAAT